MKSTGILLLLLFFSKSALTQESTPLNYSIDSNWVVKNHQFDSLTGRFLKGDSLAGVDVFFVYPTLISDKEDSRWNAEMDDLKWKNRVKEAISFQASAFASVGRTFAPYYRQAHLRSYDSLETGGRNALLFAYADVRAALQYYMENYNNGRAIILAGHSQGSTQLHLLLKEFFDGTELQNQLIAAYLPGISVKETDFKHLKLLTSPESTGGYLTWNSFKWNYDIPQYHNWYHEGQVVNPVSWNLESSKSKKEHKGFLYRNGKMYQQCIKPEVIEGGIRMKVPKFPHRYLSLAMKHYHVGDINFFWEDIRLNALLRSQSFLKK